MSIAKKLFGTDGIRGVAGEPPLDGQTVFATGLALGAETRRLSADPEVLIGMDTRESGPWIAALIAGGLAARDVRSRFAGVITTPGVAYLTRTLPFAAGVMISASHNPYQDNGIKVFGHSGYKLPDGEEQLMEKEIFRLLETGVEPRPADLETEPALDRQYEELLLSTLTEPLSGLRLVIDCGNGAAYRLAPELFQRVGAAVIALACEPNGRNINLGCGALYVESLQSAVLAHRADGGVAFDGDADRAIFVSAAGRIIDGDAVLLLAARDLKAAGRLPGNHVIATVMSNFGLEKTLEQEGVRLSRTGVGDKYVLEEMLRTGAALGGEQSGHVIFHQYATTGDGMLTALRVFEIVHRQGRTLDELTADFRVYPQKLINVRVRERRPLSEIESVRREIERCDAELNGAGRILVRYSGTEPLARVMVEAANQGQVEDCAERIASAIRQEIGVD
jgi:phosphoglucosamine mutase